MIKLEELANEATRAKTLSYILAYERNNDIDYLTHKSKSGIAGWEAQTICFASISISSSQ